MSSLNRITSLLVVQKGRVDRAMASVHERNGALRDSELERDAARARWTDAVAAYQLEQERLTKAIAARIASKSASIRSTRLTNASLCCDDHRRQVSAAADALAVAEDKVLAASTAAMEARASYRRALARQDALLTLQASLQKAQERRVLRLEEQEV